MKIGMVTSSYPRYEGDFAGVFVKSLAETLAQVGHEVHVLAAHDPDVKASANGSLVKLRYFPYAISRRAHIMGYARSLKSDAKLMPLALGLVPIYVLSGAIALSALCIKERFDLIHAHWVIPCGPIGAIASNLIRVPLVISLHGSDVFVAERNRLYAGVARSSFRFANSVVACSDDLRIRATAIGCHEARAITVPYGVDVQRFSNHEGTEEVRTRLKAGEGVPLVMTAGRLVGKKGFEYFIQAVPRVLEAVPQTRFAVIGEGDDRDRLVTLARELGVEQSVAFLGAVPWTEMPAHLGACDVFVVPSVRDSSGNVDGLPNTLLEAMGAGRAIVATRVAGIPQVVSDGECGMLVAEKSPGELADAILALLRSPELSRRLGQSARERVRADLSWETAAQRYSEIYAQALDARRRASRVK